MRLSRVIAGAMTLAAAVMATAGNASAAVDEHHVWTKEGVRVQVWEHGDYIQVEDTKANGYSAAIEVWVNGKKRYILYASGGKGDWSTRSASYGGEFNLPEGAEVDLNFWGDGYNDGYTDRTFLNDH